MSRQVTIYHNPRCSKSRDTLNLLKENGVEPQVVLYLDTPPDADTLKQLQKQLGFSSARHLMRQKEEIYSELKLGDPALTEDQLIAAIAKNPKLLERPIVVTDNNARIGRPPEAVLEIIQ